MQIQSCYIFPVVVVALSATLLLPAAAHPNHAADMRNFMEMDNRSTSAPNTTSPPRPDQLYHDTFLKVATDVGVAALFTALIGAADAAGSMQVYAIGHESPCGGLLSPFDGNHSSKLHLVFSPLTFQGAGVYGAVLGHALLVVSAIALMWAGVLFFSTVVSYGLKVPNGVLIGKELMRVPRMLPTIIVLLFPGICFESCMLLYGNPEPSSTERVVGAVGLFLCTLVLVFYHTRAWFIQAQRGGIVALAFRYPKPLVVRRLPLGIPSTLRFLIAPRYWWGREALRTDRVMFAQFRPQAANLAVAFPFHKVIFPVVLLAFNPATFTSEIAGQRTTCHVLFALAAAATFINMCFVALLRPYRIPLSNLTSVMEALTLGHLFVARALTVEPFVAMVSATIFFAAVAIHVAVFVLGFMVDNFALYAMVRHPERLMVCRDLLSLSKTMHLKGGKAPRGRGKTEAGDDVGSVTHTDVDSRQQGILVQRPPGQQSPPRSPPATEDMQGASWSGRRSLMSSNRPPKTSSVSWVESTDPVRHPSSSSTSSTTVVGEGAVGVVPAAAPPTREFKDPFVYHCSQTSNVVEETYSSLWRRLVRGATCACIRDMPDPKAARSSRLERYLRCKRFRGRLLTQGRVRPTKKEAAEMKRLHSPNGGRNVAHRRVSGNVGVRSPAASVTSHKVAVPRVASVAISRPFGDSLHLGDEEERELYRHERQERLRIAAERRALEREAVTRAQSSSVVGIPVVHTASTGIFSVSFLDPDLVGGSSSNNNNLVISNSLTPRESSLNSGSLGDSGTPAFRGFRYGKGDRFGSPERRRVVGSKLLEGTAPTLLKFPLALVLAGDENIRAQADPENVVAEQPTAPPGYVDELGPLESPPGPTWMPAPTPECKAPSNDDEDDEEGVLVPPLESPPPHSILASSPVYVAPAELRASASSSLPTPDSSNTFTPSATSTPTLSRRQNPTRGGAGSVVDHPQRCVGSHTKYGGGTLHFASSAPSSSSSSLTDDAGVEGSWSFREFVEPEDVAAGSDVFWSSDTWPTSDLTNSNNNLRAASTSTSSGGNDDEDDISSTRTQIMEGLLGQSLPIDVRVFVATSDQTPLAM